VLAFVGCCGPCVGHHWLLCNKNKIKNLYIKKQLKNLPTYGPNNASGIVWALFRLCGPALAFVGCCGPVLTCIGLRWLSLAAVGLRGLLWVSSGQKMGVVGVVQPADVVTNIRNT
jgi:hypothetical protein